MAKKKKNKSTKKKSPTKAKKSPAKANKAKKAKPKASKPAPARSNRKSQWLDETTNTPVISAAAQRLNSFIAAMADGRIDDHEIAAQEQRLVDLMRKAEPLLDDAQHALVTQLLCESAAYDIMKLLHEMGQTRSQTQFHG